MARVYGRAGDDMQFHSRAFVRCHAPVCMIGLDTTPRRVLALQADDPYHPASMKAQAYRMAMPSAPPGSDGA